MADKKQQRGWQCLTNGWVTSEVLIHVDKCSQSNTIQIRPAILRYNFRNHCFLGPLIFHSLCPCFYYMDFYYLGFMHSCMLKNTTFHECFKILFSLYFKANFIRLALHSRMFKNTTFHEWAFHKIFISFPNTLYWW